MKTLQRIHRAGIATVLLAAVSVCLSAGSAQARPKNACQNYIHMMAVTMSLADQANAKAGYYLSIGDYDTATGYQAEAEIWGNEYDHWSESYSASGC